MPSAAAILLDAGGVLLDEAAYEAATREVMTRAVADFLPGYRASDFDADYAESIARFAPHNRQYVAWKRAGGDGARFDAIWARFKELWSGAEPPLALMPAIGGELRALRGRFGLVLAGQYGRSLSDLLRRGGLDGLFVNALTQDDFPLTKPDPRYFAAVCAAAGVEPGRCVMVGDRIDKDVVPARQNGMGTVFVRTGAYRDQAPRGPDEVPDLVLGSTAGMARAIIERWG